DTTAPCAGSATPTGAHDPRTLLALQRAAGNRAVGALLARRPAPVQRSFKRWKPKEGAPLDGGFTNVDAKAKQIDAAVDTAYGLVVAMLKSQKAVKLPGVSDNRYASWIQTITNPFSGDNARAASTGYIIEDNATFGFRGDP